MISTKLIQVKVLFKRKLSSFRRDKIRDGCIAKLDGDYVLVKSYSGRSRNGQKIYKCEFIQDGATQRISEKRLTFVSK